MSCHCRKMTLRKDMTWHDTPSKVGTKSRLSAVISQNISCQLSRSASLHSGVLWQIGLVSNVSQNVSRWSSKYLSPNISLIELPAPALPSSARRNLLSFSSFEAISLEIGACCQHRSLYIEKSGNQALARVNFSLSQLDFSFRSSHRWVSKPEKRTDCLAVCSSRCILRARFSPDHICATTVANMQATA